MNLSKVTHIITLAVAGFGASAVTLAIFLIPDLSAGVLAGLIVAHLVLSAVRWGFVFSYGSGWLGARFRSPVMVNAV